MDIEWSNISNNLLAAFVVIALILFVMGFNVNNQHFINYGAGVLAAVIIMYILKRNELKKMKK